MLPSAAQNVLPKVVGAYKSLRPAFNDLFGLVLDHGGMVIISTGVGWRRVESLRVGYLDSVRGVEVGEES